MISSLTREKLQLEAQYENQLQTFKPSHPTMEQLRAEIEQRRQTLEEITEENVGRARQSAQATLREASNREASLERELESLRSQMVSQSGVAAERSNLRVSLASNRDLLDQLTRQQSETEVTARLQGTRESNVRVVDRALVPGGPFRPSLRSDLSSGLMAGLALGIGLIFLLDYMDRTLKSPEEVERFLGLPNLAVIPDVSTHGTPYGRGAYGYGYGETRSAGSKPPAVRRLVEKATQRAGVAGGGDGDDASDRIELLPHDRPRLAISEAYRALRTALLLSSAQALEVLAITSATAGEGKTATSTNLAIVMAQLGRKVLLIDGDLRKPRLHTVFQVSNRAGLVNVLAGGEEPGRAIVATPVQNLSLLPSGPTPPNPSELLASDRMRELTEKARQRYDLVIIDTPPVLAVTDAVLIGSLADGLVLCLRAGKVLREEARACRDRLLMSEIKILGTVLNRHREGRSSAKGQYYAYYGTYGNQEQEADPAA
jgi:capsular exopolysaccharide synthesis family protein